MPNNPKLFYRKFFATAHRLLVEKCLRVSSRRISGSVLMLGAGHDPYSAWFSNACQIVRCDIMAAEGGVDVVTDAHYLSFRDTAFDCVIGVEVFEHLHDPTIATKEIHRVLRKGGVLYLTVPFMFRIHGDPDDFYRITKSGWRNILSNFEHVEIKELGSRLHVISDLITTAWPALSILRLTNHLFVRYPLDKPSLDSPSGYFIKASKNR